MANKTLRITEVAPAGVAIFQKKKEADNLESGLDDHNKPHIIFDWYNISPTWPTNPEGYPFNDDMMSQSFDIDENDVATLIVNVNFTTDDEIVFNDPVSERAQERLDYNEANSVVVTIEELDKE